MRTPLSRIVQGFLNTDADTTVMVNDLAFNKRTIAGYNVQRFITNNFPRLFLCVATSESMKPALLKDENFACREVMYLGGMFDPEYPAKNDLITFWEPGTLMADVKRVIGLPSDTSEIGRIPHGNIFVLGDKREHSVDSRSFGFLPIQNVFGIVLGKYLRDDTGEWIERLARRSLRDEGGLGETKGRYTLREAMRGRNTLE